MQKKWGKAVLALLAFVLAGTFYCMEIREKEEPVWETEEQTDVVDALESQAEQTLESVTEAGTIYVHICGAVQKPGVYEVPENCRLYELLAMAGGATEEGCADALNLADILQDGQRIVIPTASEAETMKTMAEDTVTDGLININTASAQQLMELPGIGEAKAADIIRYREENGDFQSITDIMKISGIKDALFQKIKDLITV